MADIMQGDPHLNFPSSMLFFGCGNMGGAMLNGWIAAGIDPERFSVIDPFANDLPQGVRHIEAAAALSGPVEVLILAIKPQMLAELREAIAVCVGPNTLIVSILAGIGIETLQTHFSGTHIMRLMPNLAASIGKSPMAMASNTLNDAERAAISGWMAPLGTPIWIDDESQFDAITALAGSGPAFVYRFIDALALGGKELGLAPEVANELALAMVEGAAILAAQSSDPLKSLAAKVTSPGGTTAAGLAILDEDDRLSKLISATLRAARDRGVALGKGE